MQDLKPEHRHLEPLSEFSGSLSNRVYLALKNAIFSVAYRPGEILRKGEVCQALGVSRSPVSEAVAKLANDGLVEVIPQAGTFVSRLSMARIREGAFTREALEMAAVGLVARTVTDEQLSLLDDCLGHQQRLIEQNDSGGFYRADRAMHGLILSFTGYKNLAKLAELSWVQVDRARNMHLPTPGRLQETLVEHREIVEALIDHDPKLAQKLTRQHLAKLIKYLEPMEREHPEMFEASN